MNGLIAMIVRGLYSSAGYLRETHDKQQLRELHAMLLCSSSQPRCLDAMLSDTKQHKAQKAVRIPGLPEVRDWKDRKSVV